MMGPPRPTYRPDWRPRPLQINDQTTKIASRTNKIEKSSLDSGAESSARMLGFGCQSALVSALSTLIMACACSARDTARPGTQGRA